MCCVRAAMAVATLSGADSTERCESTYNSANHIASRPQRSAASTSANASANDSASERPALDWNSWNMPNSIGASSLPAGDPRWPPGAKPVNDDAVAARESFLATGGLTGFRRDLNHEPRAGRIASLAPDDSNSASGDEDSEGEVGARSGWSAAALNRDKDVAAEEKRHSPVEIRNTREAAANVVEGGVAGGEERAGVGDRKWHARRLAIETAYRRR